MLSTLFESSFVNFVIGLAIMLVVILIIYKELIKMLF